MSRAKFWNYETVFVVAMGAVMACVFGTSFYTRHSATKGSQVIDQMLDYEKACQTITDDDVDNGIHKHC